MRPGLIVLFPLAFLCTGLGAGELAAPTAAKIIRVIVQASGGGKVECGDKEIAGELSTLGVSVEQAAKTCWAGSEKEAARLAGQKKLVICGNPDWLTTGAAVAITAEGGRPAIYLSIKNLGAIGVTLPDSIVKISKVVK
jgi:hypothetical protein